MRVRFITNVVLGDKVFNVGDEVSIDKKIYEELKQFCVVLEETDDKERFVRTKEENLDIKKKEKKGD